MSELDFEGADGHLTPIQTQGHADALNNYDNKNLYTVGSDEYKNIMHTKLDTQSAKKKKIKFARAHTKLNNPKLSI